MYINSIFNLQNGKYEKGDTVIGNFNEWINI
jgi:hypothetical protein